MITKYKIFESVNELDPWNEEDWDYEPTPYDIEEEKTRYNNIRRAEREVIDRNRRISEFVRGINDDFDWRELYRKKTKNNKPHDFFSKLITKKDDVFKDAFSYTNKNDKAVYVSKEWGPRLNAYYELRINGTDIHFYDTQEPEQLLRKYLYDYFKDNYENPRSRSHIYESHELDPYGEENWDEVFLDDYLDSVQTYIDMNAIMGNDEEGTYITFRTFSLARDYNWPETRYYKFLITSIDHKTFLNLQYIPNDADEYQIFQSVELENSDWVTIRKAMDNLKEDYDDFQKIYNMKKNKLKNISKISESNELDPYGEEDWEENSLIDYFNIVKNYIDLNAIYDDDEERIEFTYWWSSIKNGEYRNDGETKDYYFMIYKLKNQFHLWLEYNFIDVKKSIILSTILPDSHYSTIKKAMDDLKKELLMII